MNNQSWPRITVVTPCLNQVRYIEHTILSVLGQNYPNLEYIVVDGGSTDGTVDVIRRYEDRLAFWMSEPDRGMYDAINKGFARSTGEIMAWINSDDLHLPWTLSLVGEAFANLREVRWLTTSTYLWADGTGVVSEARKMDGFCRSWVRQGLDLWRLKDMVMQEGTFWRRALWEESGGRLDSSLRLAGDYELWQRFWEHADLYSTTSPLAAFRVRPGQKTESLDSYILEAEAVWRRNYGGKDGLYQRVGRRLARLCFRHFGVAMGFSDDVCQVTRNLRTGEWKSMKTRVVQ